MRLLTRADFDGLGGAVLLKELGLVHYIQFVHPKDIQDGKIEMTADDILANMPYVKGCGLWFDHHSSEKERKAYGEFNGVSDPSAPSATRVIYNYYGGKSKFSNSHLEELVAAVDKADSADFGVDDVLNPGGWVLVSFIMDPRTGLGRYRDYRIGSYRFWMDMVDHCRHKTVEEILRIEDVRQRVKRYFEQEKLFKQMVNEKATTRGNVIVLDLRNQEEIYTGNRFLLYSLFPEQNISIQVMWGLSKRHVVMACGHSIINRTSKVDVGSLMLRYGGGGHKQVGTCQVPKDEADKTLEELVGKMNT
ncbi:MAG: exopolyphosphatase [Thermodesulfobacteriota bacterium]|nr:exopolyphosphatase [Thermodesulfobacteriota bacterium]